MKQPKIFVVDDDPDILESLQLLLSFEEYQVSTWSKASDVLSASETPDLFLLDVWLSGEDGREICKRLKARRETSAVPVVMFSASSALEPSVMEAGADAFVAKPFEMDVLLKTIRNLIRPDSSGSARPSTSYSQW